MADVLPTVSGDAGPVEATPVILVKADGTVYEAAGSGGSAATIADGANVTQGAKADAKSTATDTTPVSAMSVWKQISASVQAAAASLLAGLPASLGQKTAANSTSVVLSSDGPFATAFAGGAGTGITASASFTPAAAAYLSGDLISVAQEFAFTYANGVAVPSGSLIRILTTIVKIDQTAMLSGESSYTLPLYSATPPSAQADNDAWTLASADLTVYRGTIGLGIPIDTGAACYIKTPLVDIDVKLTGTSLFGELVTGGAATFTAVARQVLLYGVVL